MPDWLNVIVEWFKHPVWGNPIYEYFLALAILVASWYVKKILSWIFANIFRRLAECTKSEVDDIVIVAAARPISWLAVVAGVLAATKILQIYTAHEDFYQKFVAISVAVLIGIFFVRLIDGFSEYFRPKGRTDTALDDAVIPALRGTAKIFVILVLILWIMSAPLGYDVKALLAGLGVGGLAVALAAQGTLANWFGAYMIFSDRPFSAGDRVQIDNFDGTVEQVGLRSTRIRTLDGTVVTIPNSAVASAKINNVAKRPGIKVWTTVGVTYDTPAEKVEEAVAIIKRVLEADANVRKDYLVAFEELAAYSLNIRVMWWSVSPDWREYMAARERVNLATMRAFADAGIEFAFPTQTVYLKDDAAGRGAAGGAWPAESERL